MRGGTRVQVGEIVLIQAAREAGGAGPHADAVAANVSYALADESWVPGANFSGALTENSWEYRDLYPPVSPEVSL